VGGRGRGRGTAAAARREPGGAMAAGSITTLPALPEGGDGGAFAPGHFKDPNGGFFLRLQLQAEDRCVTDECFFFERLESNNYNTYRSRKYSSWYVALKRTGQYKLGSKTGPGQKAILFLPMSAKS
nr:basic fibroblast growth factor precursor, 25K - guinea pig (fragments) [Cavia porcellus]